MAKQKEIWRDIKGYEGLYQVSNLGRVKSLNYRHTKQERILQLSLSTKGYPQVAICKNGNKNVYAIHRLVAIAFIPNPHAKPEVNHISGIKTDNRVVNLEWVTPQENAKHAITTKLYWQIGQDHPRAKLTNEQAKRIREKYSFGSRKHGICALAKKYSVSATTIHDIIRNKTYK